MASQYVREITRIWYIRRNTMLNALKKILNGDTPLASALAFDAGAITSADLGASVVAAAKIMASAVNANGLRYKTYTFSFLGTAPASNVLNSGASITYVIPITNGAKMIGFYLTSHAVASTIGSVAKTPIFTQGANSIKVSTSLLIFASDVMEGVVITIEP
jgi:hypothetical protein